MSNYFYNGYGVELLPFSLDLWRVVSPSGMVMFTGDTIHECYKWIEEQTK